MNMNARSLCCLIAFATLPMGCALLRSAHGTSQDPIDGYCAAWPLKPIEWSERDTPETQAQAQLVNLDWSRRCPENFKAYMETVK